jgi:hypothetical protein
MGRKPKSKPDIEYEVCDLPITSLGGLPVIWDLAEALGLEELFNRNLKVKMRQRGYSEYQMAMAIILTFIAGGESLEDADKIRLDEVVSGSPFPHSTTVGDFLRRFDGEEFTAALDTINDEINRQFLSQAGYDSLTIDADATIIEAGGKKRQGVSMAYNGKMGFQPLMLFAAEPGLLLAKDFRPANVHPGSGITGLLDKALSVIPEGTKLHFRSDSACYDKNVVSYCESNDMSFTIAADMTTALGAEIDSLPGDAWHYFGDKDEEVAQFYYQPAGWSKPYRYIVVRKPKGQDLFGTVYRHHAIVTNQCFGNPDFILKRHRRHAGVENSIKELKSGYGLSLLPCSSYNANHAWFLLGIMAHSLTVILKVLYMAKKWSKNTIKTLRYRLFNLGGVLVRHARKRILKVPRGHPWLRDIFRCRKRILAAI